MTILQQPEYNTMRDQNVTEFNVRVLRRKQVSYETDVKITQVLSAFSFKGVSGTGQ